MAVINIDPSKRWGPMNEALTEAIARVAGAYQDQQAIQRVQKLIVPENASGPQPGTTGEAVSSSTDSRDQAQKTTGSIQTNTTGMPTPPDPAALAAAAGNSRAAQLVAQGAMQGYQLRHQQALEEQQTAFRKQQLSLEAKKYDIEAKRLNLAERHTEFSETMALKKDERDQTKLGMELDKYPLMMQNLKTSIAKNQQQLESLRQEQSGVWSPDEIHQAVESWAASGFKQTPNFGWGRGAASVNRNNFWREALSNKSMTAEQRRTAVMQFQMQHTEAQTAAKGLANLQINMQKADQLAKPIQQSLEKLQPLLSNSPMFNRFKRAVLNGTGDPAFSGADIYVHSFLIAYAKSLNPNGVLTEGFRDMVDKWLDTVASPSQLTAKLNALRTDMNLEQKAFETGTANILGQGMRAGQLNPEESAGAPGPTAAPAKPADNDPFGLR